METSKSFYKHTDTGEVYAVKRKWNGEIVGSFGPLTESNLRSLDTYNYTPDRNGWLKDAGDKLILVQHKAVQ